MCISEEFNENYDTIIDANSKKSFVKPFPLWQFERINIVKIAGGSL